MNDDRRSRLEMRWTQVTDEHGRARMEAAWTIPADSVDVTHAA